MKLFLHIGTEKTGTTSIQHFFKVNREKLLKDGIYYPRSTMINCGNHRWMPAIAYNNEHIDDFTIGQGFKDTKQRLDKLNELKIEFLEECKHFSKECEIFVLSSEHFQSCLRSEEEIFRLNRLLSNLFDQIQIVIYMRDPLQTAVSLLSEALKWGGTPNHLADPSRPKLSHICNHHQTLELWSKCFPDSNFMARIFERDALVGGDVVHDFCSLVIPNFTNSMMNYDYPPRSNETLTLTGMALLRKMNMHFPHFIDKKINPMRGNIASFIMNQTNDGTRFVPSAEEFQIYKDYFYDSNESVRIRCFPSRDKLFTSQPNFAPQKIDLESVEIDISLYESIIKSLWEKNQLHKSRPNRINDHT